MEGINSDERYFEGLLTVQMKDKQGEVTIVDELYKVLPVWIDRGAPISDTHSNRIVGKGINYSRTTVKGDDGGELPAIKITGKIFKNYELDNVIWEKIKNNEYKGLSFGGATRSARSPIKMKDGSTAYALSDLEHYEVAVCKDPAVPMAIITDFNQIAKANFNSTVRDDGKMVIQCSNMSCMVKKDSLVKIEDDKDEDTKITVLDEWKHEAHPDSKKADEDKPLNKPMRDDGDKKFKVYVKDPATGKTVTVRFGDPNMEIKRDDPERRSSFRARHDCDNAKDITTPKYWSCKMWEKGTSVTEHTNKADDEEDEEFYHDEEGDVRNDIEKFMEKKEMFEAVTDNPEEDTKGTLSDEQLEKAISNLKELNKILPALAAGAAAVGRGVLGAARVAGTIADAVTDDDDIEKGDGSTNTEDRNNRSDLNDLVRDKRQFNGTRGTLSEELPNMTIANPIKNGKNAADLNESQTFEQKVQALIREGKSRESAEKIVGSFVHKEAAGGNGMGGGANSSGSGGMSGGGTLTTDSGGTNNPVHNNGCDCTCKDCKRNDKCDCCEKCKRNSKGLDISNTNSVGTSSAYNQDAPNGSRLNNKADDIDLDKIIQQETENVKGKKGGGGHRSLATRLTSRQNAKKKATREVNKVHALMKLNKIKTQLGGFAEESAQARIRDQSSNTTPKPRTGNAPIKGDGQGTWNERNYPNRIDDAKLTPSSESTSYAANDDHERERTYNQGTKKLPKGGKSPKDLGKTSSFKKPAAPKMNSRGGRILDPSGSDDRSFGEIRDQEGTIRDADEPSPKRTIKSLEALTKKVRGAMPKPRKDYTEDEERDQTIQRETENFNQHQAHFSDGRHTDDESSKMPDIEDRLTSREYTAGGKLKKALEALTKEMIGVGSGIRGGGSSYAHTQGQGNSTQVTIVPPRPEDDRVASKKVKNRKE
jgi:hypothetical protein